MDLPGKLWNRNFWWFWQGQVVSLAGSSLTTVAFALWVADATGSASLLGAVMMVGSLTGLIVSPIAGAVADRYPRVLILVVSDVVLGVLALALAGVFLFYPAHPAAAVAALFLLQVGEAVSSAFFSTAARAVIPDLVPTQRIPAANAVTMATLQAAGLIGKGLGGVAYRVLGAPLLFLLDGLTFLASAGSETWIRVPAPAPGPSRSWRHRLTEVVADTSAGFRYVWGQRGLRTLVGVNAAVTFFLDPLLVMLPFLVTGEKFGGLAEDWYGYLLSGFGLGTLAGYSVAALLPHGLRGKGWMAGGALSVAGVGFAALGLVRHPVVALVLMVINGVLLGGFSNFAVSRLQTGVPDAMRARTLGVFQTLALCLSPLAVGLAGLLADALGSRLHWLYVVCGGAACLAALAGYGSREYRSFLAE